MPDRGPAWLDSSREGMIEGFSLGNYLLLVDYTGRLFREGKATISREVAEILERIGSSARWLASAAGATQAPRRPSAGPVLRGHAGAAACGGEAVRRAPPGQPGRLPGRLNRGQKSRSLAVSFLQESCRTPLTSFVRRSAPVTGKSASTNRVQPRPIE